MPPLRFLIITTTLVGLLHYYIGSRLLSGLDWSSTVLWLGWVALALSALLQPVAFLARGLRSETLRDRVSWIAMTVKGA